MNDESVWPKQSHSLCPSRNRQICSRARRKEAKKRSVLGVHEHFSPTSNTVIGQKGHLWTDTSLYGEGHEKCYFCRVSALDS